MSEEKLTQQEAIEKLAELVEIAENALKTAEKFSNEYNLEFGFSPAYGMGGWYESGEWHPSSESCY